jgi:HK97 family phage prohead protease
MPWGVEKGHGCQPSKPWAVFKLNPDGSAADVVPGGCHVTKDGALAHQRALYANEPAAAGGTGHSMRREHLTVPVEWKAADGGTGELEGYASVFGNIDQGGDVVVPGAFTRTLDAWRASAQPLPLIADHDLSTGGLIGSVKDAHEDKTGLWVRAVFSGTDRAQDIRKKMIEGHLRGMSFTYEAVKHRMGDLAGKSVRFLQELRLFEATVTPFPMNTLAIASAKTGFTTAVGGMDFAAFREAVLAAAGIEYGPASKAALDVLLAAGYTQQDPAADDAAGEPTDSPETALGGGDSPTALAGTIARLEAERARNQMDRLQAELTDWGNKQ